MPIPDPNVHIAIRKSGRAKVTVGGVTMAGVLGVELVKTMRERVVDGQIVREPERSPVWKIEVSSRFVNCQPEADEGFDA